MLGALLWPVLTSLASRAGRLLVTLVAAVTLAGADAARSASEAPIPNCKETTDSAGTLTVTVENTDGDTFGVLMVLIDYPENLVFIPGGADQPETQAVITDRPAGAQCVVNDRDHELQVGCLSVGGFPEGRMFRVAFGDCAGGEPPSPAQFTCTVLEAADTGAKKVPTRCTLKLS